MCVCVCALYMCTIYSFGYEMEFCDWLFRFWVDMIIGCYQVETYSALSQRSMLDVSIALAFSNGSIDFAFWEIFFHNFSYNWRSPRIESTLTYIRCKSLCSSPDAFTFIYRYQWVDLCVLLCSLWTSTIPERFGLGGFSDCCLLRSSHRVAMPEKKKKRRKKERITHIRLSWLIALGTQHLTMTTWRQQTRWALSGRSWPEHFVQPLNGDILQFPELPICTNGQQT